ncbi:MAG TPA: mechanosensitive ion channel protein [Syntrophus sp. (in: bacteria)]|nr:mechanosensitive ion channel protein [Syntrophus sp. (in: bacteria)]
MTSQKRITGRFILGLSFLIFLISALCAVPTGDARQSAPKEAKDVQAAGAPVVFDNRTLFSIQARVFSLSHEERAKFVQARIAKLADNHQVGIDKILVTNGETSTDVSVDDLVLMTVTDADAKAAGKKRLDLAQEYAATIQAAIGEYRKDRSVKSVLTGMLFAVLFTVVLGLFVYAWKKLFVKVYAIVESWKGVRIPAIKFQKLEILSSRQLGDMLIRAARLIYWVILLATLYFYTGFVLTFFPWTKAYSSKILGYILTPLSIIAGALLDFLPNLFFLTIIVLIMYYLLKLAKFVFSAVEKGVLVFPGFYPEWAPSTYAIVRFLLLAFGVVAAFPYLPGSDAPAFKGVSIFIGVLLSLGSTAAVANVVAGLIMTYMRAFRIGDRVRISDATGDVVEKTLLVTRLRTIKNEEITIPNAMILGSHIVNYSSSSETAGLILHTGVTIGYDVPWREVHACLTAAAAKTAHILKAPAPFVFQTSLDDSYVSYELNAYTDKPAMMASTYSELHQNIQDTFNEAGIEIMSPHYAALREGNQTTIPEAYLPESYTPPAFRVAGPGGKTGGNP